MATGPIAVLTPVETRAHFHERPIVYFLAGCWALTKPEINFVIAGAVASGFFASSHTAPQNLSLVLLLHVLLGTFLAAGGAGALNQVIERRFDALMLRTSRRPLVVGSVSTRTALWLGITLAIGGVVYLALEVSPTSSYIAGLAMASYLFIYTPLKRRTPLCTFVGALSGAAAPLIGCAAASRTISPQAWILYLMLFLWQFPHFMAIAWMYRGDYARAGYKVLPRCKGRGRFMGVQSLIPALLLVPISLIPTAVGDEGYIYCVGTMLLGCVFAFYAVRLTADCSSHAARKLLFASVVYLPSVLLLTALDKK